MHITSQDRNDKRPVLALIVGPRLIERNMEHVVYSISDVLSQKYKVILLGAREVSDRIAKSVTVYPSPARNSLWRLVPLIGYRLESAMGCNDQHSPDVYLALSAIGVNGLAAVIAGRLTGKASVVRLNSDVFNVYNSERGLYRKVRLYVRNNILGRLAMRLATKVVALHEAQRIVLKDEEVQDNRLVVIPPPIGKETGRVGEEELGQVRAELGFTGNEFVIGYVGRLDYGKCPNTIRDVIAGVLAKRRDAYCVVVGDGEYREWLMEVFAGEENVKFIGQKPRLDLPKYYSIMDVLFHTSISEGYGLVVAEALAAGVPVVALDSGDAVRALTSNIALDGEQLIDKIISQNYILDLLSEKALPDQNKKLWHQLISSLCGR